MYELARIRLFSVGPPGARYQDVCLDLRGVGPSVRMAPQPDLFARDDLERLPRRPSPASVLFLENGGGKSVLLKLVFSVLLPGRRQVVGTTNTRVLEKFVLGDDVAHVALEWMHTVTGERVVTGKVSEWRGHVVSTDPAKLVDAWYSFRPGQELSLDELPFSVDRRRVTLAGFRDRLDQRNQRNPGLGLVWCTVHREWSEHLIELGLDPELFRYQRAMNAGEGEAAEAFSFPSDEAFVDFLLRAVVDPEEPQGLAEVVAGYADKIAQRTELEMEREFVAGTLELLGPLAEEQRRLDATGAVEDSARQAAGRLAASIAARHRVEAERLGLARATMREATEEAHSTDARVAHLRDVTVELRRLVAALQCEEAEAAAETLREQTEAAEELTQAWQAVDPVLRDQLASAEAARLRRVITAEQERARPALQAREAAATALATALHAVVDDALAAARAAEDRANESAEQAESARARELRWTSDAAEHRASVDQAHLELGRVRDLVASAVQEGLLEDGAEVAGAAASAERDERAAVGSVEDTFAELTELRTARRGAEAHLAELRDAASACVTEADSAASHWREAEAQHSELVEQPRLSELLGVDTVRPDQDTSALLERLAASMTSVDGERSALRDAHRRDLRATSALGDGGLLPGPEPVEQTLGVLEKAGIAAQSGWRYLASLPEREQTQVIERLPHLVSGVLLNNPEDATRARAALLEARLLPSALVAVGSSRSLSDPDGAATGVDFVVPPNPALYDDVAADRVRAELANSDQRRRARLAQLDDRWEGDRALADRLRRWRDSYPPGTLDELSETRAEARARARETRERVDEATASLHEMDAHSDQLDEALPRLRATENATRQRAARLVALQAEVARRGELSEVVLQRTASAASAERQAAQAREAAARAHRDSQEHLRAQDRSASVAATARDDLAELPTELTALAGAQPPEHTEHTPLSVLRAEYRKAQAAYAAAEVDADLRAGLAVAEREAESARGVVDALAQRVRERANELLRSPDGADASSRRAAADHAGRALRAAGARLQSALTEVALAARARDEHRPRGVDLEPYGSPSDIEHGTALIERAEGDRTDAERAAEVAQRRKDASATEERSAEMSSEGFGQLIRGLDDQEQEADEATAFQGDVEAATSRLLATRTALREARRAQEGAGERVRHCADAVAHFAQESRFGTVSSPVRRHILGISRAEMPPLAASWVQALRPRLRSLEDDLTNIGRHRSGIVTRLQGMVGEALRTLRLAGRLSQLPDGLADWSGQQFIRFRFDEPEDDTELAQRLGEVVDRTSQGYLSGGKEQRDGMSLLLRGVRAAMPKGVRVEMLKPDAVLRTERLRVSEIRDVFSGGQQLTAAIVLYCTMAALRANQRGEGRRPHAGVLFLDNPIGRASASYLLELQFGVARALGVQLVYTTGLFDAGALSAFPLIVRLRNDADLRAGRKYLSVDDQIARQLDQLAPPDGSGQLAAVRVFRRPEPASS